MSRRPIWKTLIERFDPETPVQEKAWRASRSRSPAQVICERLDIPVGIPRVLVTGTVGTGKTTELYRIAEERTAKEFVVFVDLERHFSDVVGDAPSLQHISSWEVCFLMGVALLRAAEEQLHFELPKTHSDDLQRAWSALAKVTSSGDSPSFDVAALAKSMIVLASSALPGAGAPVELGLKVLEKASDSMKWSIPFGRSQRPMADQERPVQALLACVNTIIGLVQQRGSRVLLVMDGVDRLDCPMVVCGPFALRHHPATAAIRGFYDVPPLVNEPVLLKDDPRQKGPGVAFFRELFDLRSRDLSTGGAVISEAQLDKLAYYSGGRAREFVTFIRRLAELGWQKDVDAATDEIIDRVLDERRKHRETGLHTGHIRVLEEIARDPKHRLPEDPLAQDLLSYGHLLPYPNESEWYYPHPLLLLHLLQV
ncbi:MAG: hypothetical protein L6Q76_28890 [Polyangiaceae bacterium]|nr:hypothetical protein [Polyangiaceae bacterium]